MEDVVAKIRSSSSGPAQKKASGAWNKTPKERPPKKFRLDLKKVLIGLGALVLIFGLGPCLPKSRAPLGVGVQKSLHSLPHFVALDQGYLEKSVIRPGPPAEEMPPQLIGKLLDGSLSAVTALPLFSLFVSEIENPGQLRISHLVLAEKGGNSNAIIVRKQSDMYKPNALAKKTIAVLPGRANVVLAKLVLRAALPADAQFKVIEMTPDAQLKALADRKVHAILAFEPMISMALNKGTNRVLIQDPIGTYIIQPVPLAAGVVSVAALRRKAKQTRQYVRAINRAIDRIGLAKAECREIGIRELRIELQSSKDMSMPVFLRLRDIKDKDFECLQRFANILFEEKVISKPLHVRGLFMKRVTVAEK